MTLFRSSMAWGVVVLVAILCHGGMALTHQSRSTSTVERRGTGAPQQAQAQAQPVAAQPQQEAQPTQPQAPTPSPQQPTQVPTAGGGCKTGNCGNQGGVVNGQTAYGGTQQIAAGGAAQDGQFSATRIVIGKKKNTSSSSQSDPSSGEPSSSSASEPVLITQSDVVQEKLPNGLRVLLKPIHASPVITVQMWYDVGSKNENQDNNGISHFLEHLFYRGTKKRPIQFSRLLSALGADNNAFTSYDQTAYYATAERGSLDVLLELEADRMLNMAITDQNVKSEKGIVVSELEGELNSSRELLDQALLRSVFKDHPYGLPTGGEPKDVKKFTTKQVFEYYRKYYNPDNAVLIVVGDFNVGKTNQTIHRLFSHLKRHDGTYNGKTFHDHSVAAPYVTAGADASTHSPLPASGDEKDRAAFSADVVSPAVEDSSSSGGESGPEETATSGGDDQDNTQDDSEGGADKDKENRAKDEGKKNRNDEGLRKGKVKIQTPAAKRHEVYQNTDHSNYAIGKGGVVSLLDVWGPHLSHQKQHRRHNRREGRGTPLEPKVRSSKKLRLRGMKGPDGLRTQNEHPNQGDLSGHRHQFIKSPNKIVHVQHPGGSSTVQMVWPLPPSTHTDVPALKVLAEILWAKEGSLSRLHDALVSKQLATSGGGELSVMKLASWYTLYFTAGGEDVIVNCINAVRKVLADMMQSGVDKDELSRAIKKVRAAVVFELRDVNQHANQLGMDITTANDIHYTDELIRKLSLVKSDDIVRVVRAYFSEKNEHVGVYVPDFSQRKAVEVEGNDGGGAAGKHGAGGGGGKGGHGGGGGEKHQDEDVDYKQDPTKFLPALHHAEKYDLTKLLPNNSHIALPNKLEAFILSDHDAPMASFVCHIFAGEYLSPPSKTGLAGVVAKFTQSGTRAYNHSALSSILDNDALSIEIKVGKESVKVEGKAMRSDFPLLMHVLAQYLRHATFPESAMEARVGQALSDVNGDSSNPEHASANRFDEILFPESHPYVRLPSANSLKNITHKDVVDFYNEHYRPESTYIGVAGDVSHSQLEKLLQKEFGDWKPRASKRVSYPPTTVVTDNVPAKREYIDFHGKKETYTRMGHLGVARTHPLYYATKILNEVIGGDALSSRLGAQIRDKLGLAYDIVSEFDGGRENGTLEIQMQTSPKDTEAAVRKSMELLTEVHRNGVEKHECDNAKRSLMSSHTVQLVNPNDLTKAIVNSATDGDDIASVYNYPSKIESVTCEQVNQAAREVLKPSHIVVVSAGPPLKVMGSDGASQSEGKDGTSHEQSVPQSQEFSIESQDGSSAASIGHGGSGVSGVVSNAVTNGQTDNESASVSVAMV